MVALWRIIGITPMAIHVHRAEVNIMKIGTMFSDVARSFFQRPITEKYPFTRPETPWSLRGCLMWDPVECTGCGMCARDCPANALEMVVIDKKAKR